MNEGKKGSRSLRCEQDDKGKFASKRMLDKNGKQAFAASRVP
jgi:hypothetical protein